LSAGSYNVTITDLNGCTKIQTVDITEPLTILSSTVSQSDVKCKGAFTGSTTVSGSGGTPTYTYNWSPSVGTNETATNLSAGSYNVTITDANSCTKLQTVNITEPAIGLGSTITSQVNVNCAGGTTGSATVDGVGGTPTFTYDWSPNVETSATATGLSAGSYNVTLTDANGCTKVQVVDITEKSPIDFTASASSGNICAGETVSLSTTTPTGGTAPFTYTWLPAGPIVNPTQSTPYTVVAKDANGCDSKVETVFVTVLSSPIADFDTVSSALFNKKYNFTDKSTDATTWNWDFGNGTTSNASSPEFIYPGAGSYTVTLIVTNQTGCSDTTTKLITIAPVIIIPNVFTPNGDGNNDEFWIPNTGFENFQLDIFDRWGLKLFSTDSGDIRWDGRTNSGQAATDGTYYYVLKGKLKTEDGGKYYDTSGFVTLIR